VSPTAGSLGLQDELGSFAQITGTERTSWRFCKGYWWEKARQFVTGPLLRALPRTVKWTLSLDEKAIRGLEATPHEVKRRY
jgi:hypothetical protein